MSELLPSVPTVSEAWLLSLERTLESRDGRAVHVVSTVTEPGTELAGIRLVLDDELDRRGAQSVQTVAETIFPVSLYPAPAFAWSPGLAPDAEQELDDAADTLYGAYNAMLPLLLTADGNSRGTYFSRMVTWPGKAGGGVNQLAARIARLRGERVQGRRTHNALDVDIAADGEEPVRGLQVYAATDRRIRGFPCLTHIDLTLYQGRLHLMAVYRHQYLIEKAYGNLLGLSWLMDFLCQQSGFERGELVVHATLADSEERASARALARDARATLEKSGLVSVGER